MMKFGSLFSIRASLILASASIWHACHVQQRVADTTRGATTLVVDQLTATGGTARIAVTDRGRWRFEVPLMCTAQQYVEFQNNEIVTTEPNMATFVVGIVAGAVGGVLTARGVLSEFNRNNPLNYAGPIALATGVSLVAGPWFGNGQTDVSGRVEKKPVGKVQVPCGTRPIPGRTAQIEFRSTKLFGTVNDNGEFSVSPFQTADVFDLATMQGWDVRASLQTQDGDLSFANVIDVSVLAPLREVFLSGADFDSRIEPVGVIPRFEPPAITARLTNVGDAVALRIILSVANQGGDSWALRARIESSLPDVNGRLLYFGHVAKGQTVVRELLVPLAPDVADRVRGSQLDLSAQLLDAYGTAPAMPVRLSGIVLNDMPR
jgi:hypothetical protein